MITIRGDDTHHLQHSLEITLRGQTGPNRIDDAPESE